MTADSFRLGQLQFQQQNLMVNQLSQIAQPCAQIMTVSQGVPQK